MKTKVMEAILGSKLKEERKNESAFFRRNDFKEELEDISSRTLTSKIKGVQRESLNADSG